MGKQKRKRKRHRASSRATSIHDLPDDLLEVVLLGLDSPVCLVRAGSTCKRWRRVVGAAAFLRQFRSLHPPPIVGCYRNKRLHIWRLPPHIEFDLSPSLSPTIDINHFYIDFLPALPSHIGWRIKSSRGSLLLLNRQRALGSGTEERDMFVCAPLARRFERVPPLTTTSPVWPEPQCFLLNGAGEPGDDVDLSNFRILHLHNRTEDGTAGIFTSKTGSWRRLAIDAQGMRHLGFAAGCIYFYAPERALHALDLQSGTEFSSSLLPDVFQSDPFERFAKLGVTTSRDDGNARVLFLGPGDNLKVLAKACQDDWVVEKTIQLSTVMLERPWYEECYIRLSGTSSDETQDSVQILAIRTSAERFSFNLNIKTEELEPTPRDPMSTGYGIKLPWPPTFRACTALP